MTQLNDTLLIGYLQYDDGDEVPASPMQVILEPSSEPGKSVIVETNPKATVATLISSYCSLKDVAFSPGWVILDERERPLPQFSTLASIGIVDGQKLKISYKNQSFLPKQKWPFIIALVALIICVAGILVISMIYGLTGGKYPDDYGVVMDAGSSKTNTLLYSWKGDKHKGTGYVTQADKCLYTEGIADMDPMELGPVINCAKQVTERIELPARNKTPLYFAATAGMRLLYLTDPQKVEDILEQLRLNLTKTGLSVEAIEIISGRDEGFYGWITANFLRQTLEIAQKTDPWVPTTYGALDMGGASMQISYALPDDQVKNTSDFSALTLYGQKHNLFSYSNLCFGRSEAEARYRSLLVSDFSITENYDPCSPAGYTYNLTGEELFKTPCTQSNRSDFAINMDPSILKKNYIFIGTSDPNGCARNVSILLDNAFCNETKFKECFRKADNIPQDQKYLAFATYYFTTNFFNVTESNMDDYLAAVEKYCLLNKTQVEKITKKAFGKQYCFNGNYITLVLTQGFGFKKETWSNLEFVGQIAGKDVGWSLGYMINATNFIPSKAKTPKLISATALTCCLIAFIVIVVIAIIFILKNQRK